MICDILAFSSGGIPFASHSGVPLGLQVIGVMLIGFLFAFPGTLGLIWIFEYADRKRRLYGVLLAAFFIPLALSFYGWGFLGHPFRVWGFCW